MPEHINITVDEDEAEVILVEVSEAVGMPGPQGDKGEPGSTNYQIALNNGFIGTEVEWLLSIGAEKGDKGDTGDTGKSAFEIAQTNGYLGSELQWLESLKGAGSTNNIQDTLVAGTTVSATKVVIINVDGKISQADSSNLAHLNAVIGIASSSGDVDATLNVISSGVMSDPSWNWTSFSPIFFDPNGTLTQVQPLSGFIQKVAIPRSANSIIVDVDPPIKL